MHTQAHTCANANLFVPSLLPLSHRPSHPMGQIIIKMSRSFTLLYLLCLQCGFPPPPINWEFISHSVNLGALATSFGWSDWCSRLCLWLASLSSPWNHTQANLQSTDKPSRLSPSQTSQALDNLAADHRCLRIQSPKQKTTRLSIIQLDDS